MCVRCSNAIRRRNYENINTRRGRRVFYIESNAPDKCVGAEMNDCADISAPFQRSQITVECILSGEEEQRRLSDGGK